VAVRAVETLEIRPPGVVTLTLLESGDVIPKRGSGPKVTVVIVPSGIVVFVTPSDPTSVKVERPLGSVSSRCVPPLTV